MANKKQFLPIIPVRGFIVFPKMTFHFDVARKKSIAAIEQAVAANGYVFLAAQKDAALDEPAEDDIYGFGTIARIKQMVRLHEGGVRILAEGMSRGRIIPPLETEEFYEALIESKNSSSRNLSPEEYAAFLHRIHSLINDFISLNSQLSAETLQKSLPEDDPSSLADAIAGNLLRRLEDKQIILETTNVKQRFEKLVDIMASEVKILEMENVIANRVKEQMDDNNRDYYLREQLKAIRAELGEDEFSEADMFRDKIDSAAMTEEAREKALYELKNFERLPPTSPESAISRHYLEVMCDFPWGIYNANPPDIKKSRRILDEDHCGMEKVKKRIIEQLSVFKLTDRPSGSILCLLGAPGVGKTSIARSIARAAGREYVRISLGGVRDEAEIRGHRKTYIGAMPGRIINALTRAKTSDPLILLDEIDKLGSDYKGDPSSALLEVLDGEQNSSFRDNFMETGVDLSKVMFIATANNAETIPAPLYDRLEIIEMASYTEQEKLAIAEKHLIPKELERHGLSKKDVKFTSGAVEKIIRGYTREAGVRKLEREIAAVCRQAAAKTVAGDAAVKSVTDKNISEYLGAARYTDDLAEKKPQIGLVNGLAWTSVGGEVLKCEALALDGSGKIKLTGKLGDVMKESAETAVSFVRSLAAQLGIDPMFYKNRDIHIHFPEGAVPKDGPSAGITVATAVASALSEKPVRCTIAMTGEISLRGRVLPIGGLKEKTLGAYRLGIREIIIPQENVKDLEEIPVEVRDKIIFHPVTRCEEVFALALMPKKEQAVFRTENERSAAHEYS